MFSDCYLLPTGSRPSAYPDFLSGLNSTRDAVQSAWCTVTVVEEHVVKRDTAVLWPVLRWKLTVIFDAAFAYTTGHLIDGTEQVMAIV